MDWWIASLGVIAVVIYNRLVFGVWNVSGGYSDAFTTGALSGFSVGAYLLNVFDLFLSPRIGFLTTSPVLALATYGAIRYRSEIPGWAKSAVLAGIAYLLVHAALNRVSGGAVIFYRYPLEAIILAAPAWAIGVRRLWLEGKVGRRLIGFTAILSIALQALNVFYLSCLIGDTGAGVCIR